MHAYLPVYKKVKPLHNMQGFDDSYFLACMAKNTVTTQVGRIETEDC